MLDIVSNGEEQNRVFGVSYESYCMENFFFASFKSEKGGALFPLQQEILKNKDSDGRTTTLKEYSIHFDLFFFRSMIF